MNGILGKFHTNNQSVEVQLMRKFLRERDVHGLSPPAEAEDLFDMRTCNSTAYGSLRDNNLEFTDEIFKLQALAEYSNLHSNYSLTSCSTIHLLPPLYKRVLSVSEINYLKAVYSYIYTEINIENIEHFSLFCVTSKKCMLQVNYSHHHLSLQHFGQQNH